MILKNGIKVYSITFCSSSLLFGLYVGTFQSDVRMGIFAGLLFGVLFTACMVLFSKHLEKKSEHLRIEISKSKKIVCEGPANHKKGTNAIGGWLFLSENTLEFYPHKINIGGQNLSVSIDNIVKVETKFNRLKILTKSGDAFTFVVNKTNLWNRLITEML